VLDEDLDTASAFWSTQLLSNVKSIMNTEDGTEQQLIQEIQKGIDFARVWKSEEDSSESR
jgi:hypothetical protein